jgi:sugar lactone lactonase YvrE
MRSAGTQPEVTCVVEARNACGEGPIWHPEHDAIYWTDINGFTVQRYRLSDGDVHTWHVGEPACALSLTTDPSRLLLALGSQVILWNPDTDTRDVLARPETDLPGHRLNDGATDPAGVFWVGSMPNNVAPDGSPQDFSGHTGALYRVLSDGTASTHDTGFGITNTLVWSPDHGTFYCGCSVANVLYAYDFDEASSTIANRRPFFAGFERGAPDGSAVDAEGYLWNCRFGGKCIVRIAPSGDIDRVIEMPTSNITNSVFGGHDLRTLYVTTAALDTADGEPLAGGLFAIRTDVPGLPTFRFRIAGTA